MTSEETTFLNNETYNNFGSEPSQKFTFILLFSALVMVLSSFQFGYTISVINSPEQAITGIVKNKTLENTFSNFHFNTSLPPTSNCDTGEFFQPCIQQTSLQWSIFVSSFIVSALLGSLIGGPISDLIERRTTIFISNFFFIVGNFLTGFFSNYYVFLGGRFFGGFGIGLISVVVPVYLAEISPAKYRGAISTLHQLFITIAILTSQSLGIPFSFPYIWRFLFLTPILISLIQIVLIPFCPMSPIWLYQKGFVNAAENSLKKLRGTDDVQMEMDSLQKSLSGKVEGNFFKRVFRVSLIKPILIGVILHSAQQFSGVNAIFFYSTKICKGEFVNSYYFS
jgi:MFS family permease